MRPILAKPIYLFFFFIFAVLNLICSLIVLSYVAHTPNISHELNIPVFFAINIQQVHGIILLFSSILLFIKNIFFLTISSFLFSMGLVFFSLNIYLKFFFNFNFFSKLIPFGGILLFIGWGTMIVAGVNFYYFFRKNYLK